MCSLFCLQRTYILLAESQKGINALQWCSVENQKGANAIDFVQPKRLSGSHRNIFKQCLTPFLLSTDDMILWALK